MPADIEACTRHVGDKADNPFALCQWMKKESRGYFAHGETFDADALAGEAAAFAEAGSPGAGQHVLRGVNVFKAGDWQGDHYSLADLDSMVSNFRRFSAGSDPLVEVPFVVGHEEDQDFTGRPAVGWVRNLWRKGSDLFADVEQIYPKIARLIENGSYKHVSPEIYPPEHPPEGVEGVQGHMLRRLSALGGSLPHIKQLEDMDGLLRRYAEGDPEPGRALRVTLHPSRKTWQDAAGAWACFSEVRQMADDATTQIAEQAIRDAYPDLPDELIQSFTPEQLSILAGSMAGQTAPAAAPEEAPGMEASPGEAEPGSVEMQDDLGGDLGAPGAGPGRDEMITQLVAVGEDPAALQAMSDEDLQALYQQRIGMGGEAGEGAMPMAEDMGTPTATPSSWPMTPMAEPESLETSMPTMDSAVATPAGAARQPTKVTMTQHFSEARVAALEARLKAAEAFARRAEQMARRKHAEGQR